MPPVRNVAVFVGSLRRESFTRKVASAVIKNFVESFARWIEVILAGKQ